MPAPDHQTDRHAAPAPELGPATRRLLDQARRRLDRQRANRYLAIAALLAGLLLVVGALAWVLSGYQVAGWLYPAVLLPALAIGGLAWWRQRQDQAAAAHECDRQFALADSLRSSHDFSSGRRRALDAQEAAMIQRQLAHSDRLAAGLDADRLALPWPRRLLVFGIGLLAAGGLLGLVPEDARITAERQERQSLQAENSAIIETLEDLVDEIADEEAVEPDEEQTGPEADELRQWIEQLQPADELAASLRQYARLEQQLQHAADRLDQRQDEAILARAGEELAGDAATAELGKQLQHMRLRDAGRNLRRLQPRVDKLHELKNDEQLSKRQLAKLRRQAQRLASASGKLAASAKRQRQARQGKPGKPGAAGQRAGELAGSELTEAIEELDQAAQELLKECQGGACQGGACRGKLGKCEGELDRLARLLRGMQAKRDAQKRLRRLAKAVAAMQSKLGSGQNPGAAAGLLAALAGGKSAGQGRNDATREADDQPPTGGQATQLQGQKGAGPSEVSVEAAASGSGSVALETRRRERSYQRQMEDFLRRDDIPEDLRAGVKTYFQNIHEHPAEAAGEADAPSPDSATPMTGATEAPSPEPSEEAIP